MLVHDSLSFPMDYLLKPVTEEELRECLQNVREELDEEREQNVTEEIFRICGADISSGFARKVMTYFSEHVDLNLKDISDEFLLSHDYFGKFLKLPYTLWLNKHFSPSMLVLDHLFVSNYRLDIPPLKNHKNKN